MYERFFGLADAPFRLTPDPRYLFLSRKHEEVLAHLKLGLRESSGFVCITGDVGTGKTTLLRAFLSGLGSEVATAYIFNPALSALELLQTINGEFGLPATSPSPKALTDALNAHLLAQREAGRRAIVVIDEAQALAIDVLEQLRLLSNLETTTEKLLRIVLVGQPQLRPLLLHPELVQLNQRITLRWHMGPLDARETAAYVRHRLNVASGGQAARIFTRGALRLVHRYAGGVPRVINLIAHRAMVAAFAADRRMVNARCVRQAHREVGSLPLPVQARPSGWRAARAAAVAAAGIVTIAAGAGWMGRWPAGLSLPHAAVETSVVDRVAPPVAAPEPEVAAAPEPVPSPDPAPPPDPAPAAPEEPAPAPAEAPPPAVVAAPTAPVAPAPAPAEEVIGRLARLDSQASARESVAAMLAAWRVPPLDPNESTAVAELPAIARRRGLEHLVFDGNSGMLRLLDLPAMLELRLPGGEGIRYVSLAAMSDGRTVLTLDRTPTPVEADFVERHWFGRTHVFWRDFEALGPTLGQAMSGPAVGRLQAVLKRAGLYDGPETARYDAATEQAVLDFQRSRLLVVDGRVGRFTRIVLYAAAGGYPRPTLAADNGAAS